MGKGQKRKNAGVGLDFRRVKAKVGKKLPKAQNETDTSFKSRAISLPEQLQDKSGAAVTHRNLTLKELLSQCGHYSDKVRREAVSGLAELVGSHPRELSRHATLVMETLAERITDGDKGVRSALRGALASPILPAMGGAGLGPFVPLLMAHVCSAMTHLADQIRADALGFLDLLASWRPDLVAASFLAPALHHFGDLLSKGSRGRSLSAGSLAALHRVMSALEQFLGRVAGDAGASCDSGSGSAAKGNSGSGSSERLLEARQEEGAIGTLPLFRPRCGWPPLASGGGGLLAMLPTGSVQPGAEEGRRGPGGGSRAAVEEAARQLLGHLLDCWSDCGPAQLTTEPELVLAQCLLCTLRSCNHLLALFGTQLAGNPSDHASLAHSLLRRVAPVFPVQLPAVPPPQPVCDALVQLNVATAQLLARFLPSQLSLVSTAANPGGVGEAAGSWPARLLDWFEAVMVQGLGGALPAAGGGGGLFSPAGRAAHLEEEEAGSEPRSRGDGSGCKKGRKQEHKGGREGAAAGAQQQKQRQGRQQQAMPADVYEAALEGTWRVLPLVTSLRRRALLGAAWALWGRSGVRSPARKHVLRLWCRLLADPAGSFRAPQPPAGEPLVLPSEALQWLQAMPRFLWELGPSSPATTESALRLLLDGARYACCDPASLAALQAQLTPLFATLLPAKGGGKLDQGVTAAMHTATVTMQPLQQRRQRLLPGPLAQQTQRVQALAVDLILNLPSLQAPTLRTAALLCLTDAYPSETSLRLLDVVTLKAAREGLGSGSSNSNSRSAAGAAGGPDGTAPVGQDSNSGGGPVAGGFGGLLLCLLAGCSMTGVERSQQTQSEGDWRRHEVVVQGACRALLGCGYAGELAQALASPLLELCQTSESARPLYGALLCGAVLATAVVPSPQHQGEQQAARGAAEAAAQGALLPPTLAAELPGVMLAYTAACQPSQREPTATAGPGAGPERGGSGGGAAQGSDESEAEWTPAPSDAVALSMRLLGALPSALPATLDCLAAALQTQQGAEPGAALASRVAAAWLAPSGGRSGGTPTSRARAQPAASWVAASVGLLEGVLGLEGEVQQLLLEEEQKLEAALRACEAGVGRLEGEGHTVAAGLRLAAQRCQALLANILGRDL